MQHKNIFRVLVFSKTAGYRHDSIDAGIQCIENLGSESRQFMVDASEDAQLINETHLSQYTVLVLLQNSGDFLDQDQLKGVQKFVRNGGGVVGIHCAAAGMTAEPWYGDLIGAVFTDHPEPQDGLVKVEDNAHPIVSHFQRDFNWHDEWYNFAASPRAKGVKVLLSIDEGSYRGGNGMGENHPLAWCREFDGGRSFYTSLGHFDAAYTNEMFHQHLLSGILWAATRQ
ncbi:carboxylesterase-like protein [Xylariaceae sp. FL0016]|nr:carboxylesterase-like protein [Xylariaceae sp. FL0016]